MTPVFARPFVCARRLHTFSLVTFLASTTPAVRQDNDRIVPSIVAPVRMTDHARHIIGINDTTNKIRRLRDEGAQEDCCA